MMKKSLALLIFCLFLASCGYQIAGFNRRVPIRLYIERVKNETRETSYGDLTQDVLDRYFIKYGEMASKETATYFLYATLLKVRLSDNIVSSTKESLNSNLNIELRISIVDRNGREVFVKNYEALSNFNISPNVSLSLQNRAVAIQKAVKDALDLFHNDFNIKAI